MRPKPQARVNGRPNRARYCGLISHRPVKAQLLKHLLTYLPFPLAAPRICRIIVLLTHLQFSFEPADINVRAALNVLRCCPVSVSAERGLDGK